MKHLKYKHIFTWGKMIGSRDWYIKDMQSLAERDNAPLDAVCKNDDGNWFCASKLDSHHHFWKWHNEIWQQ
jgi:hypothetical protein